MDNSTELGQAPVGRLLWKYFVPAIIGVMANILYNIVDRVYIGRGVGALALSGVTVTFPIMIVAMAFSMLVGMGSASLVSIRLGQGRRDEAEKIIGHAFVLLAGVSLTITALALLLRDPILSLFGAGPEMLGHARSYITIILLGNVLQGVGFGLNNVIRAEGNARAAMTTMLLGATLNLVLDPIFIFVCKMGVAGAALATVISMSATCSWVLAHFTGRRSVLRLRRANFRLEARIVKGILAIGMAPFAMQLAGSVIHAVFNIQLIRYGSDLAVGAMGIIQGAGMMAVFCVIAVNMAAQPIIGFNYGARSYPRVKRTLKIALIAATAITSAGFLAVQVFPAAIIGLFSRDDPRLLEIGVRGMRILLAAFPVVGSQVVSSNFFQAIGKAKTAMFLNLLRQVILLIPLVLLLPLVLRLDGVWLAGPFSDIAAAAITAVAVRREVNRLNLRQRQQIEVPEPEGLGPDSRHW
ncbi:MAG: MATE family efflux transporter [Candidatus Aminicenantes bacterium]|nr:MATE family efflux transporter [Candidatus Aminicenantes bacterium]